MSTAKFLLPALAAFTATQPDIASAAEPKSAVTGYAHVVRPIQSSHAFDLNGQTTLILEEMDNGRLRYRPEVQSAHTLSTHKTVCSSYGMSAAIDVVAEFDSDVDFVFACDALRIDTAKIEQTRAQGCHASATMVGPNAVIQGVMDVFEGEALLEKDDRPGSVSGTLAVSVAGMCGTTISAEVIGGAGASRNLFLPIGCTLNSTGVYSALATASICGYWDTSSHQFTVIPN